MTSVKDWNILWRNYLKKMRLEHVFVLEDAAIDFLHELKIHSGNRYMDVIHINFGKMTKPEKIITYELRFVRGNQEIWFYKSFYMNHGSHAYWTIDEFQNEKEVVSSFKKFSEENQKEIMRSLNQFPFEKMIYEFNENK